MLFFRQVYARTRDNTHGVCCRTLTLMDSFALFVPFFANHYGPNNGNPYLGAYVSILSPHEPILKKLSPNTPSFSAQYGQFSCFLGGSTFSMNVVSDKHWDSCGLRMIP